MRSDIVRSAAPCGIDHGPSITGSSPWTVGLPRPPPSAVAVVNPTSLERLCCGHPCYDAPYDPLPLRPQPDATPPATPLRPQPPSPAAASTPCPIRFSIGDAQKKIVGTERPLRLMRQTCVEKDSQLNYGSQIVLRNMGSECHFPDFHERKSGAQECKQEEQMEMRKKRKRCTIRMNECFGGSYKWRHGE
ncbi:hypothetical protein QJS10_CPA10g01648 [Acorus calamus]|uniref:Uncharacterized protein n=1 Tax=Acorus calamus TaxID=4465 RepID=A0AAV9DXC4_ACOCL|nr:hypothetical protein QJS10_CPA10g01648 [Acorus calamus]